MTRRVEILLSTFNGADWLPQQLESLLAQDHSDWRLLWRDDGSSDGTVAQMERFIAAEPRARACAVPGRLGVTASFAALLHSADPAAAAYAFCDQDDVWLPGKLSHGLDLLGEDPAPSLLCGRLQLVDADLRPLGLSPLPRRAPRFGDALVENRATGCATMINRAAADLLRRPWPAGVVMHDWWAYLCVLAAGGRVHFQDIPQLLYRQHGGNAVGIAAGRFSRWRRRLERFRRRVGRPLTEQAIALRFYMDGRMKAGNQRDLDDFIRGGPALAFDRRFRRQSPLDDCIFRAMRLMGLV